MSPRARIATWLSALAAVGLLIGAVFVWLACQAPRRAEAATLRAGLVQLTGLPGPALATGSPALRQPGLADASWRSAAHPELPGLFWAESVLAVPREGP